MAIDFNAREFVQSILDRGRRQPQEEGPAVGDEIKREPAQPTQPVEPQQPATPTQVSEPENQQQPSYYQQQAEAAAAQPAAKQVEEKPAIQAEPVVSSRPSGTRDVSARQNTTGTTQQGNTATRPSGMPGAAMRNRPAVPQAPAAPTMPSSTAAASAVSAAMESVPQAQAAASQPVVEMQSTTRRMPNVPVPPAPVQPSANPAVADAVNGVMGSVGTQATQANQNANQLEEEPDVNDQDNVSEEMFADPETLAEAEDAMLDQEAQDIIHNLGPEAMDDDGAVIEKAPAWGLTRKNATFHTAFKRRRNKIKGKLAKSNKVKGVTFTGVIFADTDLPLHCISIGSDLIEDSLRDPNSGLFQLVKDYEDFSDGIQGLTFDQALRDIGKLANIINNHDIPATVEKSPVNQSQSVQVRTVRIHPGGGIGIHPTQAKAFNADFDSDTMTVNMDPDNVHKYGRAMNFMIGNDGNPTTDMDFFLVDEIEDDQVDDVKFCMKNMELAFKWAPNVVDLIFDDYKELCNSPDKTKALRKLIYKINEIAPYYSVRQPDYVGISRICKSLYDFGNARRAKAVRRANETIVNSDAFEMPPDDSYPLVIELVDYVNGVVAGRPAMNSVEFGEFFNKQFADYSSYDDENPDNPSGRNIPFRLIADFCKAIHRTDLITIGDPIFGIDFKNHKPNDPVSLQQVWEVTCAAIFTKRLKGAEYLGSHQLSVKTQVQERILKTVGLPDYNGSQNDGQVFAEWLFRFIDAYNLEMRVLNMSNIAIRNGYRIEREKVKYDGIDMNKIEDDIGTALLDVFGSMTLGRILPKSIVKYSKYTGDKQNTDKSLSEEFFNMSLSRFAMTNRLRFSSETVLDDQGNPVTETYVDKNGDKVTRRKKRSRKEGARERLQKRIVDPYDILMLVADRRTAKIGDYAKSWESATKQNVDLIEEVMSFTGDTDFEKYMGDVTDMVFQVSPDMFEFFGMVNMQSFSKTKYGTRLVNAGKHKDVEAFRSELVTMLITWRLNKSSRIQKSIHEAESEIFETPENNTNDKLEELEIALEKEYELLGGASPVWSAIVKEITAGAENSLFRKFIETKSSGESDESEWTLHAEEFWKSEEAKKYGTLITFLKSDAKYSVKMAVLADITRFHENFPEINPKQIIGYLAYNPDRFHDGSPFDMDMGIQRELDAVKGSIDSMSSYKSKTPIEIRKQHAEFMDEIKKDIPKFDTWLTRMATEQNFAVHVDPILAADVISTVFDKSMPDSEKVQQQAIVNGYFECVSLQKNGGFYTHLEQSDNKPVNVLGYDQVTSFDLIKVLGNPEMEIYVYDQFGAMSPEPLSRRSLCGGNSIMDVINFLEANPIISAQVRRTVLGVSNIEGQGTKSGIKSRAKVSRLNYSSENDEMYDEVSDKVFGLLSDRPRFFASCCLITPSQNDVARNIAEHANDVIRYVCNMLADCALTDKFGIEDDNGKTFDIDTYIDETFQVSEDRILSILLGEGIEGIDLWDEDFEQMADDAHAIYMTFHRELCECVEVIQKSKEFDGISFKDIDYDEVKFQMSSTSVRAFQDVIQQFSGARTAKMLSVEGAETKRNECFKVFIREHKEKYSMEFSIDGLPTVIRTDVENPEDLMLGSNPNRQQKSIAKFLEIKRETGAEKGNAKVRKFGDDGKNTIVKFNKYDDASIDAATQLRDDIMALYDPTTKEFDRDTAVQLLAQALIEADEDLGYIDENTVFMESDYLNRADLMIAQNSDGSPVIRTLEQLSTATRSRLDDAVIYDMTKEQQDAVLASIVEVVGTDKDPMRKSSDSTFHDILIDLPIHGVSSKSFSVKRARNPRSSSVDRNYMLMFKLAKKYARNVLGTKDYLPPARAEIEENSKKAFYSLDKKMKKAVRGFAFPKRRQNESGKWVDGTDWSKSFDLLGRANSNIPIDKFVPGPQSVVLFNESIFENEQLAKLCYTYGVTIAIYSDTYPDAGVWDGDLIQVDDHLWVVPCFDMKLNGSFASPIMPAPAQIKVNASNYTYTFKDTTGEFGPSDAGMVISQSFADRTHPTLGGKEPEIFTLEDLFPNTIANIRGDIKMELCTFGDVMRDVINQYELENGDVEEIDFGVDRSKDERGFNWAVARYNIRMKEYIDRFYTDANESGLLTQNCCHDSIIGFVKVNINNGEKTVYAPIIPFPPSRSGVRPKNFNVTSWGIDDDTNSFFINYEYAGGIDDQVVKFYEGYGPSNKFVVSRYRMKERTLENGHPIDGGYFQKAVASRLAPTNQRVQSLVTCWLAAKFMPEYSYNFAMVPGAFPGDPKFERDGQMLSIRDSLISDDPADKMTRKEWEDALPNIKQFFSTEDGTKDSSHINAMAKNLITKAVEFGTVNPNIILCSRTENALLESWITEFETFLNTTYGFEDAWLKWMHVMNPLLVPNGIEGDDSKCLFKVEKRKGAIDPYGTLLCMIPHFMPETNEMYKVPECLFISPGFFGDTFSGIKNINYDSNNRFLDSLNVADRLTPKEQSMILQHGSAGMSNVKMSMNAVSIAQDNMVEMEKGVDDNVIEEEIADNADNTADDNLEEFLNAQNMNEDEKRFWRAAHVLYENMQKDDYERFLNNYALSFDMLSQDMAAKAMEDLVWNRTDFSFDSIIEDFDEVFSRAKDDMLTKNPALRKLF